MKKISGKRGKTDADLEELSRLEWYGGLYLDEGRPCIPGEIIEATFVVGAKKRKKGNQAKAGVFCDTNAILTYNGSNGARPDLKAMWESGEYRFSAGVVIQKNRIMRTRPRFNTWETEIAINFDDELLNPSEILDILKVCGAQVGLCEWRPKFGRFTVEEVK